MNVAVHAANRQNLRVPSLDVVVFLRRVFLIVKLAAEAREIRRQIQLIALHRIEYVISSVRDML